MTLAGLNNTDILLQEDGQPYIGQTGDFAIARGIDCWKQDIMLEAATEEGELFYEDAEGVNAYGFSLKRYLQSELDDFERMKIKQQIRNKLAKRSELDERSIEMDESYDGRTYSNQTTFKLNDYSDAYNINMELDSVEVIIHD